MTPPPTARSAGRGRRVQHTAPEPACWMVRGWYPVPTEEGHLWYPRGL